jgi:hypothetical protein
VRPPFLGDAKDLLLAGEVVEPIGGLDGFTEREVARQDDIFRWSAMRRAPCTVQGPIPGTAVSSAMSSSSGSALKTSGFSLPSEKPFGEVAECADLPPGEPGLAELAGIDFQQSGG